MAGRARRERKSKLDKLAEYKRAREGGARVLKDENVEIYDEVSEEQYNTIVRGRLQKDDFVEDDGIEGYMDNGMDDWEDGRGNDASSEEESRRKKSSKKAKNASKAKAKPATPPPQPPPSMSAYRKVASAAEEDDFMSSLLGTMDAVISTTVPQKSRKRKPSPDRDHMPSSSPIRGDYFHSRRNGGPSTSEPSSDGPNEDDFTLPPSDDLFLSPKKKARVSSGTTTPAAERFAQLGVNSDPEQDAALSLEDPYSDFEMDVFMDLDQDLDLKPVPKPKPVPTSPAAANGDAKNGIFNPLTTVAKSEPEAVPSWLKIYNSLSVTAPEALGPLERHSSVKKSEIDALEPDGSLRFFWIDYLEHEGKVYFVGKLKDKTSGLWVSCCITVEGIQRNLFVLPRPRRAFPQEDEEGDSEMVETDIVPSQTDVYDDFDTIRQHCGIKTWKGKFVKRKYAFGEKDVPKGDSEWLKVVYGFDQPVIPANACSPNISHVFGTGTSAFEVLVLKRRIFGPCWLTIKDPQVDNKGVSWCKFEATVNDPKDINPFADTDPDAPRDTPPLTVMSLSVRTIVNHQANTREVVCATARIWNNMVIDDPTPPEKLPCTVQTYVRPLDRFPPGFESQAQANGRGTILPMSNERMLLSKLLVAVYQADPDVIVGHEFLGVSLDVLLHRMRDLKVDHWSRLGRFRRAKWPLVGKQGSNLKFLNGRMMCDLGSDGAKSMIASTTWSLTEMCKTHLKSERGDIDPDDTASYLDGTLSTPDRFLTFVKHCELDAHYQMAIAAKVQILPLTKQLTNLAGNAWNKTLNGGRAERNEYILLHEFHRLKYICPDKTWGKKPAPEPAKSKDGTSKAKAKRDKYKGGLVFEPKRGLWDKYILVMDFNSLYPSIIQEYNIDFTTVERVDDQEGEDQIPEPPSSEVPKGVLPRLIATLVSRRRQVKSLMKDKTATPAQLLQYDIKQQALKLTANSMYGCLGFENSRFFARPLAALTTFKGREILTHTRELAESLQLDVVYGDTDSVFVNSNVTELSEALKISADFKKLVNEQYKLLEIDLDGVFQRMLLLQKKKYAAIKVEDGGRTTTEVKGLDMKRREYCGLSKDVSQYVLEQILSGEMTETVVENIHEYLETIGKNVREGKVKLEDFVIFKRLGKNPEDYPDAKSQPHVQVALRMKSKGGTARSGDVVSYIFCLAEGEETTKTAQADRAKHPDEVRRAGSDLKIDFEFYLSQQVLPPIERLCEPIEGTDRARLAECLGLDPTRFRAVGGPSEERSFSTLDSQKSDQERFKDASPFLITCRKCHGQLEFVSVLDRLGSILQNAGACCPACQAPMTYGSLQIQLETQIRDFIARYYEGWMICDDPICGNRTRMMGMFGRRCLRPECRGYVTFEYSDSALYDQLRYYASLFDVDRILKASAGTANHDAVLAVTNFNSTLLRALSQCVEKYLNQSGRRWVDLDKLFGFMSVGR